MALQPVDFRAEGCSFNCSGHDECHRGRCFCLEGWSGPDCLTPGNSAGCPFNCSGHGSCQQGRCICDEFHTGNDCATAVVGCPSLCSSLGKCVRGRCVCFQGRSGDDCSLAADEFSPLRGLSNLRSQPSSERVLISPSAPWELATACLALAVLVALGIVGALLCHKQGRKRAGSVVSWLGTCSCVPCGVFNLVRSKLRSAMTRRTKPFSSSSVTRHEEPGWKLGEARGQLPGTRYERYG